MVVKGTDDATASERARDLELTEEFEQLEQRLLSAFKRIGSLNLRIKLVQLVESCLDDQAASNVS